MNKEKRKALSEAVAYLDAAKIELSSAAEHTEQALDVLSAVRDEEQDAYDNLPESIQSGERGNKMMEAVDAMDEAEETIRSEAEDPISDIFEALEELSETMSNIIDAMDEAENSIDTAAE